MVEVEDKRSLESRKTRDVAHKARGTSRSEGRENVCAHVAHDAKVKEGLVELVYVPSEKNQADLLTKPLCKEVHHRHAEAIMKM